MLRVLLQKIGFNLKEGAVGIFLKKYPSCSIEVDLENNTVNYGGSIVFNDTKNTIHNITKPEDLVVLECINRLLEKGYKPKDIVLEKIYPTGHGTSGRLDILVKKNNKAFLMIECKTWGKEFEKEFNKIQKDGGQVFTYFQQDTNADFLMLYTSHVGENNLEYKNEIIKIEDHYRDAGNISDFFDRWNKITNQNGIFDEWVEPYCFENKALTKNDLKQITAEDSNFIFYEFISILRKYSISDKPNAFNKIFNLFLCKLFDEKKRQTDELDFQWKEKSDNDVRFQVRLINLYQQAMSEFLKKEVEGINDSDFQYKTPEELEKKKKKWLKFNNVFAIKEVIDDESFDDNARVLKEVVELLQKYQIRYPRKQKHLSDFFELLLTTGLKQEAGQFFTPPPIARFIIKSIPLKEKIENMLKENETPKLPAIIDYAAGSGHFLTEAMEEMQDIIDKVDTTGFYPDVSDQVEVWQTKKKYDWASKYIYGIEKDYRLVKVSKVGCYFYGDGLAQVIHGDGIDNFSKSRSYRGLLKQTENKKSFNHQVFDFLISNPPYSISSFRGDMKKGEHPEKDFKLYGSLTDRSSEIECLFIERTKQLLKEDGIAAVILPSSILSNTGIYTGAREILLKYFEWVAITELGSNTFMATGTNTVVMFLRRRSNDAFSLIQEGVGKAFHNQKDVTVNGIEKAFFVYLSHVWKNISFSDYQTFLNKNPNDIIQNHEIYREYMKKIKAKDDNEKWNKIFELEKKKMTYFLTAYRQRVVLVKSGQKKQEKAFLGYEFSNRRGSEGMHPIQRGKSVDDCTKLFDPNIPDNPKKASTYILDAFSGDYSREIDDEMKSNVLRINLADMMNFDRVDFEKTVSLNTTKKIKIESKYQQVQLGEVIKVRNGFAFKSSEYVDKGLRVIRIKNVQKGALQDDEPVYISSDRKKEFQSYILEPEDILVSMTGNPGRVGIIKKYYLPALLNQRVGKIEITNNNISKEFIFHILNTDYFEESVVFLAQGLAQINVSASQIGSIKIPIPPKDIQQKIVDEIAVLEQSEEKMVEQIKKLKDSISSVIKNDEPKEKLENITVLLRRGKSAKYGNSNIQIIKSGQARGYRDFDFAEKHFVKDGFVLDERKLEKGDILINSTGVGTAGRVTQFDLDGDFVVDTHITIARLDQDKAISDYVLHSLADIGFKNIEAMATGQSGQIELSLGIIGNIKIPLPSLTEQRKIVFKIQKIEKEIAELDQKLIKIPIEKEEIMKKYL